MIDRYPYAPGETRSWLSAIVESMDDAVIGATLEGTITSWNTAAERLYGLGSDEFLGQPVTILGLDMPAQEVAGILDRIARGEYVDCFSTVRRRRDGTLVDVSLSGSPIRDAVGMIVGVSLITRDITTWKQAQEITTQQAALLDLSSDAIFVHDFASNTIHYWNRGAEALYGFSSADAVGRVSHELLQTVPPISFAAVKDIIARTGRWEGEVAHTRADGTQVIVMSRWALQCGDGRPDAILEIATDISDRKRAEDARRETEDRLARIVETNADGILIMGLDRRFTFANAAVETMMGLPRTEIIGRTSTELGWEVMSVDGQRHEESGERARRGPDSRVSGVEILLKHRDGRRLIVLSNSAPLLAADGVTMGAVISVTDITERKKMEEDLRCLSVDLEERVIERTIQLESANRELESFAYSVSHDLRAPLRSLDGFSRILLERYGDAVDERGTRYLMHIRDAAQEMGKLIDALLRLSRVTRADMRQEIVDLSLLARDIVMHLSATTPKRVIDIAIEDGIRVPGDPELLRALLENLLGNAWRYTAKATHASIAFGVMHTDKPPIYFVRDNGAGFDMTYVHKLFVPFQRLHAASEFEGIGIGLATVQRVVHRHGGRVWAEGAVNEGATIYFTLQPEKVETA